MTSPEFPSSLAATLAAHLRASSYSQLFLLADATVHQLWYARLAPHLPPHTLIIIPSGERHKTLRTAQQLWQSLYNAGADRNALCLVWGGGMTTDLGAFCAATWKRGLTYWLLPSTLLSMVDATLGGKTGIDFQAGKNLIGLFSEAGRIIIAPELLSTLPPRELRAGLAEMLKHGLVADAAHWQSLLDAGTTPAAWQPLIEQSLAIKARIVAEDPREQGVRKLLNFGHTLGHALESLRLRSRSPLLHGEAVALGIILESHLSVQFAGLPPADAAAIESAIRALGYPTYLGRIDPARLAQYLLQDKKNAAGELRFSLLSGIGQGVFDIPVPLAAAQAAVSDFIRRG